MILFNSAGKIAPFQTGAILPSIMNSKSWSIQASSVPLLRRRASLRNTTTNTQNYRIKMLRFAEQIYYTREL
jgi:hypothetical protein